MEAEETRHRPVLLEEVLGYLNCRSGQVYVDGTVGSGGHARAILEKSCPTGRLIGLDWDEEAIKRTRENLAPFGSRVDLAQKNFKDLTSVLKDLSVGAVDGILLDLGISTEQLEDGERGISFLRDGPLDMRMSREIKVSARDILRRLSAAEISGIIWQYGEERWAKRIAKAIVRQRQVRPLRTTGELVEVIQKTVPWGKGRIHPATRTFQALRIRVNEELQNLQTFLDRCESVLNPGGRLVIISFHSLEDRIVKNHFRKWGKKEKGTFPSFCILTPKPVIPSLPEVSANPKARSAKLRAVEKLSWNTEGRQNGGSGL
ncbi:MAG: 16S rRNA (cytosine(1402)-N(4))-methyltransferase RsmH [Thermodesulfobacteriota bacterium]|nr:16S rRNA (cytosine(1402)-N(4))-methyltransferase RsmH [Thermodesulfobacteriota bacterium]